MINCGAAIQPKIVRNTKVRRGFPDSLLIPDTALHLPRVCFVSVMVSAHAYPTFELSNAVQLLAKTAPRERKLGPGPEIPYCPEIPSVTLISSLSVIREMNGWDGSDEVSMISHINQSKTFNKLEMYTGLPGLPRHSSPLQ